jgi:hypothetical protein
VNEKQGHDEPARRDAPAELTLAPETIQDLDPAEDEAANIRGGSNCNCAGLKQ